MTICAAFVPTDLAEQFRESVDQIRIRLGKKELHSTKLRHHEKVFLAQGIAGLRLRLFAVASHKPSLQSYSDSIDFDHEKYYNKCVKYLLEKIGSFMIQKGISEDRVHFIFEERNHKYGSMVSYINKVRQNPIYPESASLKAINPMSLSRLKKKDEPLFIVPDIGAHALYSCFNKSKSNLGVLESRYLKELAPVFHRSTRTGKIEGVGIKFIHKLEDLNPDQQIKSFLAGLKA